MNLARKARRMAEKSAVKARSHGQQALGPVAGDPPAQTLRLVLDTYTKAQNPRETLDLVTPMLTRWPKSPSLLGVAGAILLQMQDAAAAIFMLEQATLYGPNEALNWSNLGVAYKQQKRLAEAEAALRRAIAINPKEIDPLYNLGNVYLESRQFKQALQQFLLVLDLDENHADALNNVGTALLHGNHNLQAAESFRLAIKARPDFHMAMVNRANALAAALNHEDAIAAGEQALASRYDFVMDRFLCYQKAQICDWSAFDHFRSLPVNAPEGEPAPPFNALTFEDNPEHQLERSRVFSAHAMLKPASTPPQPAPARDGRIRIGYLSSDIYNHATMHLFAGVLREHDRSKFEIHLFSYGPDMDCPIRRSAMKMVEHFHDIQELSDDAAIATIRRQNIDILVEMKGFTQGSRAHLLGAGLAPLQVAWLGYPGSMGHPSVHYAIADHVVLPIEQRHTFDENIVWLAGSYQANDDQRPIVTDKGRRSHHGLPENGFVFCSFNSSYKITPREFDIWMRLLARTPDSVLWLLRSNPVAERNLRREAEKRGVAAHRLVFAGKAHHHEYLGRLRHADLFLDSFAVNAHTTCSDALWAGLPVLTLAGQQFCARVGASLLHAAGLPELATTSEAEYEALALELAHDRARLTALRERLAANRMDCDLFNTKRFTAKLEGAFAAMQSRQQQGLPPADLDLA
jgi:predicted O-linked N-acetylglucosamine transferase (SPINDLY family)